MIDANSLGLLAFVLMTSIWSLKCLQKNKSYSPQDPVLSGISFISQSRVAADGRLSMTPPLEQLKAADF